MQGAQRIGEETREQYHIAPSRILVLKTVRPKYACPCCREGVKIAPAPLKPIPILQALANRLAKYGMKVREKKTKLINFSKRLASQDIRQETFDFLEFTIYLGKSRKGHFTPRVITSGKRMRSKLRKLKEWLKANRSKLTLAEIWKRLKLGLQIHFNYFGVTFNLNLMQTFSQRSSNLVFK